MSVYNTNNKMNGTKEQITLFLEPETMERLKMYNKMSRKNNYTGIFNEAIQEYLEVRLANEYKKIGILQ